MPFTSGTATNHDNLLDILITFLTTTLTPSNQRWFVVDDITGLTNKYTGQIGTAREVYLRGPGISAVETVITSVTDSAGIARFNFTPGPTLVIGDEVIIRDFITNTTYNGIYNVTTVGAGYFEVSSIAYTGDETAVFLTNADTIYYNIRRYTVPSTGGNADNWELSVAYGYDEGLDFRQQPGSPYSTSSAFASYLALSSDPFPYWIVATGRYFLCAVAVSTTTAVCGGGFYLPYSLPSEYPFPVFIIATTNLYNTRWSDQDVGTRIHSNFYRGPTSSSQHSYLRHRDGFWLRMFQSDTLAQTFPNVHIFPVHYNNNGYNIQNNQDGSYTVLPYIFFSNHDGGNVYGEMENLYWVSSQNIAAKDIVQIGGVDHLVLQNVWRTSSNADFCVLRLE